MGYLRLYKKYLQIQIQSMMQYKASFCLTAVGQFLVSFNVFLGVYFMFQRFHEVDDLIATGGTTEAIIKLIEIGRAHV